MSRIPHSIRPRTQVAPGQAAAALVLAAWLAGPVAGQGMGPMPVVVDVVITREVPPTVRLVGTVRPERAVVVASEVAGPLAEFSADEGQFLKRGEVLARVEPVLARLRRDEARARLGSLRARLDELERGERPEEIRRLEAMVGETEAMVAKWLFERDRTRALFERNSGSEKEKVDAAAEYAAAESRRAQMEAALDMARQARPEAILAAREDVASQAAVLARLEHDLERTEIRAPFDAFVIAKRTEVGAWIEVGGAVADLISLETARVRVDVPESVIPFARVGAPTSLEIEALGRTVTAVVTRLVPQATASARTFPIEIDVPNADHALLAGMFVWAQVPAGPLESRLMVSKDAIVARGTSRQIFVIRHTTPDKPPMAMPLPVRTGLELEGLVEVQADGLQDGDRVVVRANERLFGPTPVILQSAAPPIPPQQP